MQMQAENSQMYLQLNSIFCFQSCSTLYETCENGVYYKSLENGTLAIRFKIVGVSCLMEFGLSLHD